MKGDIRWSMGIASLKLMKALRLASRLSKFENDEGKKAVKAFKEVGKIKVERRGAKTKDVIYHCTVTAFGIESTYESFDRLAHMEYSVGHWIAHVEREADRLFESLDECSKVPAELLTWRTAE